MMYVWGLRLRGGTEMQTFLLGILPSSLMQRVLALIQVVSGATCGVELSSTSHPSFTLLISTKLNCFKHVLIYHKVQMSRQ